MLGSILIGYLLYHRFSRVRLETEFTSLMHDFVVLSIIFTGILFILALFRVYRIMYPIQDLRGNKKLVTRFIFNILPPSFLNVRKLKNKFEIKKNFKAMLRYIKKLNVNLKHFFVEKSNLNIILIKAWIILTMKSGLLTIIIYFLLLKQTHRLVTENQSAETITSVDHMEKTNKSELTFIEKIKELQNTCFHIHTELTKYRSKLLFSSSLLYMKKHLNQLELEDTTPIPETVLRTWQNKEELLIYLF